jgi:hypothetical protein
MGLAERRAIEEFKRVRLPELVAQIETAMGVAVPIEVEWNQLAFEGKNVQYHEVWTKLFFTPVIDALKRIGRDPMGKEALQGGVKKIVFVNMKRASSPSAAITFVEGVIEIDHDYYNVGDVGERTEHLVKLIEKAL